jgi:hypothetical protein
MINQMLIWFAGIPILLGVCIWWFLRRQSQDAPFIGLGYTVAGIAVIAAAFFGAANHATTDYEIWNGQVVSKERVHDTYEQPYDCFCTTDSKGNRSCSTCYETHYTVAWDCATTVGGYQIEKKDSTSRNVYNSPDNARWLSIKPGDPVARRMKYQNFVQAVPQTLFAAPPAELKKQFAALLPTYPEQVFDFYRLNRFVTPGFSSPDAPKWNEDISMMLRELGPRKQVNLIVVVSKTDDPMYEYALQSHWDGVNKNDVVLLIGSKTWPNIDFVRVLSWTKNELFKIELRDSVQALGTIQREPILGLVQAQINKNFERRRMREFKYLESEIDPPSWVLTAVLVLLGIGAAGTYGYNVGWFDSFMTRSSFRRNKRFR